MAGRAAPLTRRERRLVALAVVAPVVVAGVVLVPVAAVTGANVAEVLGAALVYGGLLGLAAGFVAVDRLQARQCPRCRQRSASDAVRCPRCDYDLQKRPRFACDERHALHLEPGLCDCGRRLQPLPTVRGVGPEIVVMLKLGGWLLAFFLGVGVILQVLERNL